MGNRNYPFRLAITQPEIEHALKYAMFLGLIGFASQQHLLIDDFDLQILQARRDPRGKAIDILHAEL
jgi:hypothetical protein